MNNTITESYNKIQAFADSPLGDMRVLDEIPVGYHVRQGDLYITAVSGFDKALFEKTENRQLAPGTSKGSRHTVSDAVTVLKPKTEGQTEVKRGSGNRLTSVKVIGPVIVAKDRFTVSHPQHADMSCPAGTYQVSYQADPRTMARVRD